MNNKNKWVPPPPGGPHTTISSTCLLSVGKRSKMEKKMARPICEEGETLVFF